MKVVGALAVAWILATGLARAEDVNTTIGFYMTGDELTTNCRAWLTLAKANGVSGDPQVTYRAGLCLGAVMLFYDGISMRKVDAANAKLEYHGQFCEPSNANAKDLAEIVGNYVDQHPERRQNMGYVLIDLALRDKFPCP